MNNLKLVIGDEWESIVDKRDGRVILEGHKLSAIDILFALGYNFDIERIDDNDED